MLSSYFFEFLTHSKTEMHCSLQYTRQDLRHIVLLGPAKTQVFLKELFKSHIFDPSGCKAIVKSAPLNNISISQMFPNALKHIRASTKQFENAH